MICAYSGCIPAYFSLYCLGKKSSTGTDVQAAFTNKDRGKGMIHQNELNLYRVLGKIHSFVSTASDFDEAIRGASRIIVESGIADHVVVWSADRGNGRCFPFYWICPVDLTARSCVRGSGIVGNVCEKNMSKSCFDFRADADPIDRELLAGTDASSVVCAPFSISEDFEGCVEFIRIGSRVPFNADEAEMCSVLTLIAELYIKESVPVTDHAPKEVLLSAKNIRKSFVSGGITTEVLKGVNVDVFEGELLCLQGESGCGKSTFLNIAGGLLNADSGSLTFMGREISDMSEEALTEYRRDHIGFVFQSYNLMPNLTAKQNLDLIAELVGEPMDTREALALVGMGEKADNYPSQLSGGQQQRISIARALVKKPKMIFADEPTAALDYKTSIEILTVFEKIKKTGATILMVTHNEEITRMADRVIRFRDGRTFEIIVNHRPAKAVELKW